MDESSQRGEESWFRDVEGRRLSDVVPPTLEAIERRRSELWLVTFVLLVSFALAFVALSFVEDQPAWLMEFGGAVNMARAGLVVLMLAFAAYVLEKERRMRRLTARLLNSRVLEAALINRLNEVVSLGEVSRSLGQTMDLTDALEQILRIGLELMEADEGSLMLADEDALVVAAAIGRAQMFTGQRVGFDEGPAGRVATTRSPVVLEGQRGEHGKDIRWALSVPLEVDTQLVGVLNLAVVRGERAYNEYDLYALGRFAEQAAITIRQARERRRDRVRAEMATTMADDLLEPLLRMQREVAILSSQSESVTREKRHEAVRSLERDVERALELVRWLVSRNAE